MNVWKRSFLVITRKKGKSGILLAVFFCMSMLIILSMVISSAQVVTQKKISESSGMTIRLQLNKAETEKRIEALPMIEVKQGNASGFMNGGKNQDYSILQDDIEKLKKVEGIGEYTLITDLIQVSADNFKRLELNNASTTQANTNKKQKGVRLQGTRIMRLQDDVVQGKIKLVDGDWIKANDKDSIVINQALAKLNHLRVGDTIKLGTMVDGVYTEKGIKHKSFNVKIIGIYQNISLEKNVANYSADRLIENRIYSNLNLPTKIKQAEQDPVEITEAIFTVHDAQKYQEIKKNMTSVPIDWNRYDLIDKDGNSTNIGSSIYGLQHMGTSVFLLVIGVSSVVITLLLLLWTKNRTYEASIFIALGQKKKAILGQFLLETVMLFTVAFMALCISAPTISNYVGEYLVEQQAETAQKQQRAEYEKQKIDQKIINQLQGEVQNVQVQVQPVMLIAVYVCGILVSLLSICIATYPILRKPPKTLLSDSSS